MPDRPKPKSKGGGNVLTRKVGPWPAWAWALAAIGAFLVYRAYAGRSAAAAGQSTSPSATDQTGQLEGPLPPVGGGSSGGGGGGDLGGGSTSDNSGAFAAYSDILAALNAQNASLTSALLEKQTNDSIAAMGAGTGGAGTSPTAAAAVHSLEGYGGQGTMQPITETRAPAPSAVYQWRPIAATTPGFGQVAQTQTLAAQAAGAPAPFGGVTSVRTLANGATLTTYASGRQVEQVPGRSAYVVHA